MFVPKREFLVRKNLENFFIKHQFYLYLYCTVKTI